MRKKIQEEVLLAIRIMSTQAVMRSQRIADTLDLNPTDLETIEVLMREGKATAGMIAKSTGLTSGAVTGVIDRLAKAGYVRRDLDPDDRRRVLVVLNMKKVSDDIFPLYRSIAEAVERLLERYSVKELNLILDFLTRASAANQEDMDKFSG